MLRSLLKGLRKSPPTPTSAASRLSFLDSAHERAPLARHFAMLYGDVKFGDISFEDLFWRSANETDTTISVRNLFRRAQGGLNLVRYLLATFSLPGRRAECGVYRGMSSLMMNLAARAIHPDYDGTGTYLFDSFERFSPATEFDMVAIRDDSGQTHMQPPFPPNSRLNTSLDVVEVALKEFTGLVITKGWIPEVLYTLAESTWSFVHLDVDLYEPTLGGLEYFFPRLNEGGVILTDDYGTGHYPGARKAWDKFCEERNIPFVVLGTGQAVIIRTAG